MKSKKKVKSHFEERKQPRTLDYIKKRIKGVLTKYKEREVKYQSEISELKGKISELEAQLEAKILRDASKRDTSRSEDDYEGTPHRVNPSCLKRHTATGETAFAK